MKVTRDSINDILREIRDRAYFIKDSPSFMNFLSHRSIFNKSSSLKEMLTTISKDQLYLSKLVASGQKYLSISSGHPGQTNLVILRGTFLCQLVKFVLLSCILSMSMVEEMDPAVIYEVKQSIVDTLSLKDTIEHKLFSALPDSVTNHFHICANISKKYISTLENVHFEKCEDQKMDSSTPIKAMSKRLYDVYKALIQDTQQELKELKWNNDSAAFQPLQHALVLQMQKIIAPGKLAPGFEINPNESIANPFSSPKPLKASSFEQKRSEARPIEITPIGSDSGRGSKKKSSQNKNVGAEEDSSQNIFDKDLILVDKTEIKRSNTGGGPSNVAEKIEKSDEKAQRTITDTVKDYIENIKDQQEAIRNGKIQNVNSD